MAANYTHQYPNAQPGGHYHHHQAPSINTSPTAPRYHQGASVQVYICDQTTTHSHGPYFLFRPAVEKESRRLKADIEGLLDQDQPLLRFEQFYRGYNCCTLDCIIRSWKEGERFQPRTSMQPQEEVAQLIGISRALWDYQCKTTWFEDFARDVRDKYFMYHHANKILCQEWAFISVVFSWEHHFGQAVMDVAELASSWQQELPQINGSIRNLWPHPVDLTVLRYIISTDFYLFIQNKASEFIDNTWIRLCKHRESRRLADRIEEHFAKFNYDMPRDTDPSPSIAPSINSASSAASTFFQNHTTVDLWRIFNHFFPSKHAEPARPPPKQVVGRVQRVPFKFGNNEDNGGGSSKKKDKKKKKGKEPEDDTSDLRGKVDAWYDETFRRLLFQAPQVGDAAGTSVLDRFNRARRETLIISGGSEVMTPWAHELITQFNYENGAGPPELGGGTPYGGQYGGGGSNGSAGVQGLQNGEAGGHYY
ncbi:hypothetical protein NKR23_g8411 [Pleurostoma richardsiae]|uniref:Uncharacterized protein n=1 Tax=Pleurostoma richardsiae TaxID=41990 RepID=A0AA38RKA8_9PEZI|nr:hypothetical protein NKR23_g8411 [Pleurostoma richardsiae]